MLLSSHLPIHSKGQKIGLYGGSFNPPHEGHKHAVLLAMQKLRLDAVWVLVSPQNPLKIELSAPIEERMAATQALMNHPKIHVLDIERVIDTRYTLDTVQHLQNSCKNVHFVYIMGADNLVELHRWHKWQNLMRAVPICVVDRPNYTHKALRSRAALQFLSARILEQYAHSVPNLAAPAWVFLHGKLNPLSSSNLRKTVLKK